MPPTRFVILHHRVAKHEHWDVMLEQGEALLTWQLAENPASSALLAGQEIAAERIQDHRKKYLDYEGPISGDRGEVRQVDAGAVSFLESSEKRILIALEGIRLQGRFLLRQISGATWTWSVIDCGPTPCGSAPCESNHPV